MLDIHVVDHWYLMNVNRHTPVVMRVTRNCKDGTSLTSISSAATLAPNVAGGAAHSVLVSVFIVVFFVLFVVFCFFSLYGSL